MNDADRALVKKKVLILGSKDIDTISNLDVYDTYKDLYLNEIECEELTKYFYKEHSNVTWKEFLTKFGLWIDTRSTTDNTLHGSVGQ